MAEDARHLFSTIADFHRSSLLRYPDRDALVSDSTRITYRQLQSGINQMARVLKSLGLKRGDGLALLSGNRPHVIFANMACQTLGVRYTPLHPMGSEDDHAFIIDDAEIAALVVDPALYAERGRALRERTGLKHLMGFGPFEGGIDIVQAMEGVSGDDLPIEAEPEDIAYLSFTGGTTGRPKGAVHPHRSIVSLVLLELAHWEWPREIRFLAATPVSHAAGVMFTPTLAKGGTFHFIEKFDIDLFLETIQRERITATFIVPTILYALLDHPRLRDYDLSSLEMVIYGAAPVSPTRLQAAIDIFGPIFCQLYGQTEAGNVITYLSKSDHLVPHRLSSCGLPVPGSQVRILRPDGTEVETGEVGEICIRSPISAQGYWKRPDETAKLFEHDWLHTGDMARRDEDGYYYIVDRAKDLIISGGFNVFPREVEDCLSTHPAVAMSAVIGIPDPKWGEAVMAAVVLHPNATVSADELIALVRDKKGSVQAPKLIRFMDSLPLTAVGKLDKKALRADYWEGQERQVGG